MPAQPQWLSRLPEIIDEISALDLPVLDRAVFERAFRVRRRRAIHLLDSFGGYQSGRTYLIDRHALLRQLRGLASGDRFGYEKRRRARLAESIDRLRRDRRAAAVRIAAPPPPPDVLPALPAGAAFLPGGRLLIEFRDVQDLLTKLYGVAQAAAADFPGFQAAAEAANGDSV